MDLHGLESLRSLNPHAQEQHSLHDPQHPHAHTGLYNVSSFPSHFQGTLPNHHSYAQHPHHLHDPYNSYSPYDVDPLEQHLPLSHAPHGHPSSTCVPGLIPPGMDPGQVDMRTFYPYQPNEVKHRKRTTRSQLKVLEDVYKYDTKPNATLRKKLAEELGMTPRGVQVWFQNRRAKTKSQARKADVATKKTDDATATDTAEGTKLDNGGSRPSSPASASSPLPGASVDLDTSPSSSRSSQDASSKPTTNSPDSGISSTATEVSPAATSHPTTSPSLNIVRSQSESTPDLSVGIDTSLFGNPFPFGPPPSDGSVGSSPSIPSTPAEQHSMNLASGLMGIPEHLRNQRRPSLPIIVSPPGQNFFGQGSAPHQQRVSPLSFMQHGGHLRPDNGLLDPSIRRRSVDTNMTRLGGHPYAHLTSSQGGPLAGDLNILRRGSMPHVLDAQIMNGGGINGRSLGLLNPQGHGQIARRPAMFSRMSMPASHMHEENAAFEESPPRISQAFMSNHAMPLLSQYSTRQSAGAMFSVPSREIPAPIPGPLPSPGFSFGDAPTSSGADSSGASSSPNLTTPSSSSSINGQHMHLHARRSLSAEDPDTEDDASAVSSNYPFSRFGSFASVAGSESSYTSGGNWSEAGSGKMQSSELQVDNASGNGFERRPSASGQILELFHELDVNGNHTPQPHSQPLSRSRSGDVCDDPASAAAQQSDGQAQGELAFALHDEDVGPTDDQNGLQYPGGYPSSAENDQVQQNEQHLHGHSDDAPFSYSHDEQQQRHNMSGKPDYQGSYSLGSAPEYSPQHNGFAGPASQNALHFEFMGGAGPGGGGQYHNGAIELSNMCVPATMDYHVVSPYMQYS
ncbi:hypothetical protein EUX98_g8444 [Antrodiella citrinella]|uniref:Homeobox domain-containing protein n=1 Tax=Antrodiella citrinella TaxID=2447956 RepID=A0A4S4M7A3_9APHY|nr:hypothetical protein EUX98_g8444 [Antrodiella citrinella]